MPLGYIIAIIIGIIWLGLEIFDKARNKKAEQVRQSQFNTVNGIDDIIETQDE